MSNEWTVRQEALLPRIYAALPRDPVALRMLNAEYDLTVQRALIALSDDAPVGDIDVALAETFSDVFKSDEGFRPRGEYWTYARAKAWLDRREVEA